MKVQEERAEKGSGMISYENHWVWFYQAGGNQVVESGKACENEWGQLWELEMSRSGSEVVEDEAGDSSWSKMRLETPPEPSVGNFPSAQT